MGTLLFAWRLFDLCHSITIFGTDKILRFRTSSFLLLVTASSGWITLALLSPLAVSLDWQNASILHSLFSPVCHQLPQRSWFLFGEPVAACARCLGLYSGFLLGLIVLPLLPRVVRLLFDRPRLMLLFMIPMGLDLLVENTHTSRYFSGLIASFPVSLFVRAALEQFGDAFHRFARRRI